MIVFSFLNDNGRSLGGGVGMMEYRGYGLPNFLSRIKKLAIAITKEIIKYISKANGQN